jgi:hypothetical protein
MNHKKLSSEDQDKRDKTLRAVRIIIDNISNDIETLSKKDDVCSRCIIMQLTAHLVDVTRLCMHQERASQIEFYNQIQLLIDEGRKNIAPERNDASHQPTDSLTTSVNTLTGIQPPDDFFARNKHG